MRDITNQKFLHPKLLGALSISLLSCNQLLAHGNHDLSSKDLSGPRGIIKLDWQADNIARTFTAGYPDSFGISSFLRRELPSRYQLHDKQCIKANFIAFDISDQFAFNIDEPVEVSFSFDRSKTDNVLFSYDANGKTDAIHSLQNQHSQSPQLFTKTVTIDRTRFANRGMDGADFAIVAEGTYDLDQQQQLSTFGLCDIRFKRSYQSQQQTADTHSLTLNWLDAGQATSVRFGLYDSSGRAVLPSDDALDIHYYDKDRKLLSLQNYQPRSQPWPHSNRHFSYAKGQYRVEVPAGTYQLIASKGPEYRVIKQTIELSKAIITTISSYNAGTTCPPKAGTPVMCISICAVTNGHTTTILWPSCRQRMYTFPICY